MVSLPVGLWVPGPGRRQHASRTPRAPWITHLTPFPSSSLPLPWPQSEQDYPEAGISTAPSFTKYEELTDDNLDDWVENGFGEFDDVEER